MGGGVRDSPESAPSEFLHSSSLSERDDGRGGRGREGGTTTSCRFEGLERRETEGRMEGWWFGGWLPRRLGGTPVARAKICALSSTSSSVLRTLWYRRQVCISESRLASLSSWADWGASEPAAAVAAPYWSSFSYAGRGGCGRGVSKPPLHRNARHPMAC